jgi:cystathionine gamma-lyase
MSAEDILDKREISDETSIVTSTIFKLKVPGEYSEKYSYSRYGNPSRDSVENSLATMDNAKYTSTFCSYTTAQMAVLSVLKPDDMVVFSDYLNCCKFKDLFPKLRMEVIDFVDMEKFKQSFSPYAKMVFIESSTNLFQTVLDIKLIADFIQTTSEAILVVDNTFLTSHLQKPLSLGADIVVYSVNEYIGGHDDVSMGCVATNDKKWLEKFHYNQYSVGAVPSPFDCFMINRSIKTFDVRMERITKNSWKVAEFLGSHEKIEKVLKSEIDGKISGILSIFVKIESEKFLSSLKIVKVSPTSGGINSSISHPWSMTHAELSEQKRLELGITKSLFRLSIGLEQPETIIKDLNEALNKL